MDLKEKKILKRLVVVGSIVIVVIICGIFTGASIIL